MRRRPESNLKNAILILILAAGLTICHSMFNYDLPARGGTVVKAYYLKGKYGLGYSYYAALLAGSLSFRVIREGIDGDADEGQGGKPR